jgi:hypothetical protein
VISLRFIHVEVCVKISFLLMAENIPVCVCVCVCLCVCVCVCLCHILLIHSLVHGHLGSHVLAIMNKDAVNEHSYIDIYWRLCFKVSGLYTQKCNF